MKTRSLAVALSLALVLGMAGCGGQQAQQEPQEPDQGKVQQSEPASTIPPVESMEVKNENDTAKPLTELEDIEPKEAGGAGTFEGSGSVEVELFTEVNETVYATGTVNIRASYTADSDKLGSLSVGQSVTRTGTSIAGTEAEGWSRVELSDGSTAYISNKYLSTTKPVAQQPSGGSTQGKPSGQTQQQQQTQQQTQQTQQPQQTQQTPQPSGGDSEAEIAARREAFINGMGQMFEDHGYGKAEVDHDYTEEELEALVKAVQVGG